MSFPLSALRPNDVSSVKIKTFILKTTKPSIAKGESDARTHGFYILGKRIPVRTDDPDSIRVRDPKRLSLVPEYDSRKNGCAVFLVDCDTYVHDGSLVITEKWKRTSEFVFESTHIPSPREPVRKHIGKWPERRGPYQFTAGFASRRSR
jgi:hypothetical protein